MSAARSTDVLVIGGGLAGARAALAAAERGAKTLLVSKRPVGQGGASAQASGGFAAALGASDSPECHAADTMTGGYGLNAHHQVDLITRQAAEALKRLDADLSLNFSSDGALRGCPVPMHSEARSVQYPAGMNRLMEQLRESLLSAGVELWESHRAVDLWANGEDAFSGASLFNGSTGDGLTCQAAAIVLATGGCGQLFPVTSNGPEATGDGYALALRAGLALQDMEFLQFTPTAFAAPDGLRGHTIVGTLLTLEGVRLLNSKGERFMQRYAPERGEAADRATLARAIYQEVLEGRGGPAGGVFLDATCLSRETFNAHRPGFLDVCLAHGIDPSIHPLETAPSMHTCLGGIRADTDLRAARNVLVAGEALGGTHGANRLSSNSLTEANVTGWLAGQKAADIALTSPRTPSETAAPDISLPNEGAAEIHGLALQLKEVMGGAAGVERHAEAMQSGLAALRVLQTELEAVGHTGVDHVGAWLDVRNALQVAHAIVGSALMREESRGAHFRSDCPMSDDKNWIGNVLARQVDDELLFTFEPAG